MSKDRGCAAKVINTTNPLHYNWLLAKTQNTHKALGSACPCWGDLNHRGHVGSGPASPADPNPTNTELVTILVTALTIVLAFFALVIGLLAFWGYATFKTEAARIARRIAKRETSAFLKQHFEGTIGKEIDMRMERWADKYRDGIGVASSYPPQDEAEQEGKVGRDLPDENLPGGLS